MIQKFHIFSLLFIIIFSGRLYGAESPIEIGRRVYFSNCISCHNKDPNLNGAVGPLLVDSPIEIIESKIMTGKYPQKLPEGYKPKRTTKLMRPLTKLKDNVKDVYAWIQSMKTNKTKK